MNDLVTKLIDERAITNLLIEYCRALDAMDLKAIEKLFPRIVSLNLGPMKD